MSEQELIAALKKKVGILQDALKIARRRIEQLKEERGELRQYIKNDLARKNNAEH